MSALSAVIAIILSNEVCPQSEELSIHAAALKATNRPFVALFGLILPELALPFLRFSFSRDSLDSSCNFLLIFAHFRTFSSRPIKHEKVAKSAGRNSTQLWESHGFCKLMKSVEFYCIYFW